jgi:rubrerythrin
MPHHSLTPELKHFILDAQKTEISEAIVYKKIAKRTKEKHNKEILLAIAEDELKHYGIRKKYSGQDVSPDKRMVWWYTWIVRLFGVTFGLKLMEGGETDAIHKYADI